MTHFHYALVTSVVFACLADLIFWYLKVISYKLNEKLNEWAFWSLMTGFSARFLPQSILGLDGMPYHLYIYISPDGWRLLNFISIIGTLMMTVGLLLLIVSITYSHIKPPHEATGDSWDGLGRALEWSTASATLPRYDFVIAPD